MDSQEASPIASNPSPIDDSYWNSQQFISQCKSIQPTGKKAPVPLEVLIRLRTENHLSYSQIGKVVGYSTRWVIYRLSSIDLEATKTYVNNRTVFFQSTQQRLLTSITDADIKSAPMGSRVLAAAQLYDKERLETDQSTSNQAIVMRADPALSKALGKVKGKYGQRSLGVHLGVSDKHEDKE